MRLLICGDRDWLSYQDIFTRLEAVRDEVEVVIVGDAWGADELAGQAAYQLGLEVLRFVAAWHSHGRAAGPMRNRRMLEEGKPTHVWAFHNNLLNSKGTANMVRLARQQGLPVEVFAESHHVV